MTRRRDLLALSFIPLMLAGCDKLGLPMPGGKASFKGVDVTGAAYTYSLPDVDGKTRTPADFHGKVTAVFFGYVQCPDVCPTAMAELAAVKKALGADGGKLQAVFITVDPERDTPAVLKGYVGNFDPSFVALRGSLPETQAAAKSFNVFFAKAPGKTPGSYTMDHSAGIYLFDPQGRARIFERYGTPVDALTHDVKALLALS